MTTEIPGKEQKYEAGHGVPLPSLDGLPRVAAVSVPDAETLVAEYYDTSDLRLLKAGVTLRRREGGADEGWHLKLPAAWNARRARRTPAGPDRDATFHETRKAAKRARYAAEAARPVLGAKARRFARRMKKVQSVLGDHQDAVNARGLARDLGVEAHLAGESAFSFGTLYDLVDHEAREHQHRARRAWQRGAGLMKPSSNTPRCLAVESLSYRHHVTARRCT